VKMIRAGTTSAPAIAAMWCTECPFDGTAPSLQVERHAVFLTQPQVPRHSCACAGSERFVL
jgi:hypothetical protein